MEEEKQKMLQECLAYFRERPVYQKVFTKLKNKYESLGCIGGKAVLTDLTAADKIQLGGFLQKDYTENRSVTISATAFEEHLSKSRFSDVSLEELLQAYFGAEMRAKKEEREEEKRRRAIFLEQVIKGSEDTFAGKWVQRTLQKQTDGYGMLIQQYNRDPEKLYQVLKNVLKAVMQLQGRKEKEPLAVFAARVTGDPHYFDAGTAAEKLLLSILSSEQAGEEDNELSRMEKEKQIFYRAGILKDELSNDTLAYGIRAWKQDGSLHEGIEGFLKEKEPIRLTLHTIGKFGCVESDQNPIYLLENPAVFSVFIKTYPKCAAVCVNGQPRLSTLVLLDLLKENHTFSYQGDFDPEGLLIAQRLKERYGEKLSLWNYRTEWYQKYLSEVEISEVRIKKLEKVFLPELQELKRCMQREKRAAYQETMLEELIYHEKSTDTV